MTMPISPIQTSSRRIAFVLLTALLASRAAQAAVVPGSPGALVAPGGFVEARNTGAARWVAHGLDCNAYFEASAVTLDRPVAGTERGVALRLAFPAAHGHAALEADGTTSAHVNVFAGNDPAGWQRDETVAREVRYRNIAPGADIVYRMHAGRLKYDVVVAPGADVADVRMRYQGARGLEIDPDGGLRIHTDAGVLYEQPPVLYQEVDGARVSVAGGYRVRSRTELGFWAGAHDARLPLIVDPGLAWSTFLGGDNTDNLYGVTTDHSGNVYVVGSSSSTNYPTSTGAYQRTHSAPSDVVVSKIAPDGSTLIWSTLLGGNATDVGYALAVDGSGNVVVTGTTVSTDFPVTAGAYSTALHTPSFYDAFVTKISADGSRLLWSTFLGGSAHDNARAVAFDGSGNVIVAGNTGSTNFPTTAGVVRTTRSPAMFDGSDGFIAKLSANGASLMWATYLGSNSSTDDIFALALDTAGEPTVAGWTASADFPTTTGAFSRTFKGYSDAFVTRLNATASSYVFSTMLGGATGYDEAHALAVDTQGNSYVAGFTNSNDFPTTAGAMQTTYVGPGGYYDGFVSKLSPTGGTLGFSTYLGGNNTDQAFGIGLAPGGQVLVTGSTVSTNFPVTSSGYQRSNAGGTDGFAVALAADGRSEFYGTYLGSAGTDAPAAIALRQDGKVVMVGCTDNSGFPTTVTTATGTTSIQGASDGFVSVMDMGLPTSPAAAPVVDPRLALAPATPNPFTSASRIGLTLETPGRVVVRVVDPAGRLVRSLADQDLGSGRHSWIWDGTDEGGRSVGAGMYFVRVTAGGVTSEQGLVRLR